MSPLPRLHALALLEECTGDHVWSVAHCELRGVPPQWVTELADAFESGVDGSQTLYTDAGRTNQYHGVRDVDLAIHLAKHLGIDVDRLLVGYRNRVAIVRAIKEAVIDD